MADRITLDTYLAGEETTRLRELVYGVVREPPAPGFSHQIVVGRVYVRLERHVRWLALGQVVQSPVDVVLDREHDLVVQPDVVFIAEDRLGMCVDRVWGAPDLAVEVLSMGTRRHDSTVKLGWFQQYGVRECWLVDPIACRVEVVDLAGPGRVSRTFGERQIVRSAVLPRLRLRAADIFGA